MSIILLIFMQKYGDFEAVMDINTLQIIEGTLPNRVNSLVLEWAHLHRSDLMADWDLARKKEELKKIAPLA